MLLVGAGRIARLGREMGQSIREFRKAAKEPDEEATKRSKEERPRAEETDRVTVTSVAPPISPNGATARDFRVGERAAPLPSPPRRPPDFTGS